MIRATLLLALLALATPAQATILCTLLTASADNVDRTLYTTSAISPTADALVLASVWSRMGTGAPVPTVTQGTGGGLTFTQIDTEQYDTVASPNVRITTLRAMSASPGNGTVIFDFGATQGGAGWSIIECTGVRTTGSNGDEAIVQVVSTSADAQAGSHAVTLAAFQNAVNGAVSFFNIDISAFMTPDSGWTELSDEGTPSAPLQRQNAQWLPSNDITAGATWTGTADAVGVAIEIRDASVEPPVSGGSGCRNEIALLGAGRC